MRVIVAKDLSKIFRTGLVQRRVHAVVDLNLNVQENEIFGFLGPNGAGKTTTIKMLMGLISPTAGSIRILGKDFHDRRARERIGFLPETPNFYEYLTGREFLNFSCHLFRIQVKKIKGSGGDLEDIFASDSIPEGVDIDQMLRLVGLSRAADLQLRRYSKGMVQRIGVAQALINNPRLLVLDEPMAGLDPVGRKEIRDLLVRLKSWGKTIFFSTHILPDVELVCDRVGIITGGKLRQVGRLDEILSTRVKEFEVTVEGLGEDILNEAARVTGSEVQIRKVGKDKLLLRVWDENLLNNILGEVGKRRGRVVSVTPHRESLEEYFMRQVEEDRGVDRPDE